MSRHPIVYFYSKDGKHKTASFFAITSLVMELEEKKMFRSFISARAIFESILIDYDFLVQQIVRRFRSAMKAFPHIKSFYLSLIEKADNTKSVEELIQETIQNEKFNYLTLPVKEYTDTDGQEFSNGTKSAVFITQALENALQCSICKGYLHTNSISFDHVIRRSEGGLGTFENAQLTHPYCNSTIKN